MELYLQHPHNTTTTGGSTKAIAYNRKNYGGIKWEPRTADIVINHWLNHLNHPDSRFMCECKNSRRITINHPIITTILTKTHVILTLMNSSKLHLCTTYIYVHNTNDEDVWMMIEQNGFTIMEFTSISHPEAQFELFELTSHKDNYQSTFLSFYFFLNFCSCSYFFNAFLVCIFGFKNVCKECYNNDYTVIPYLH